MESTPSTIVRWGAIFGHIYNRQYEHCRTIAHHSCLCGAPEISYSAVRAGNRSTHRLMRGT